MSFNTDVPDIFFIESNASNQQVITWTNPDHIEKFEDPKKNKVKEGTKPRK